MKNLIFIFSLFLVFTNCKKNNQLTVSEIPKLLERSEKLQYSNEWPELKNKYADIKHKLTKDPNNIDELIKLCNLFISEARVTGEHGHYYNSALTVINHALDQEKISKDQKFLALRGKASVQLSLHDFRNALTTTQEAVALNPFNSQIYGALVDAYVELGDYTKAVEASDKMVSLRPDLSSYSRVSYLREIHGMPNEAIEALKMAVEAGSPGSEEKSWAALQLAQLCLRYNKVNEAESILNQILEERNDYPFAKAALADVYIVQKKYVEAEKELKEACQIIPEVAFHISLANLYKKQGRDEDMKSKLKEVLKMMEDDMKQGHNMSLEYAKLYVDYFNDPAMALKYIQKDKEMRPENIDINKILVKIYALKMDKVNAELYLQKASKTNSQNPELLELKSELITI